MFDDEPMQKRFEEAVAAEKLPDKVPMEKKAAQRFGSQPQNSYRYGHRNHFPYGVLSTTPISSNL